MHCIIAVDMGTSSCRAIAFTESLTVVASERQEYELLSAVPGQAEQDPDQIIAVVKSTIANVILKLPFGCKIEGISITAAMHSFLCLDQQKRPLTKVWTWADSRSQPQSEQLRVTYQDQFYRRTGCPFHPMYWPAKIRFVQEELPELWGKTRYIVSAKDYVLYHLTGRLLCDQSLASATGVFNIHSLTWDQWIMDQLGIPSGFLLPAMDPFSVLDGFTPAHAKALGFKESTPLIMGASDGAMSNLGCGAVGQGIMALMVGTSGAMRVVCDAPRLSPRQQTWCYYLGQQRWIVGGSTNNGGNTLQWFRNNFYEQKVSYDQIGELAAMAPAGSRGVLFLPFLAGERCPHWNAKATGVFFNLSLTHGKADLARAVLEGVAFQMYSVFEAISEQTALPRQIRVTGGLVNSPVWIDIFCNVFRMTLHVPEYGEGSAVGTAILMMVVLGKLAHLEDAAALISLGRVVEWDQTTKEVYESAYERYGRLYQQLSVLYE